MYKKIIITEQEKKRIKNLYDVNEQEDKVNPFKIFFDSALDYLRKQKSGEISSEKPTDSQSTLPSIDSGEINVGSYFISPGFENVKLNYYKNAKVMNQDAETLIKSIAKKAGLSEVTITSTYRDYDEQARVNKQNSREEIQKWYCPNNPNCELLTQWDQYKQGIISQTQYANYLKTRDQERGKTISNHINNLAFDVVPLNEKLASTADQLMKSPNSGIKKVFREPKNGKFGAIHFEFNFPVTGPSGLDKTKLKDTTTKNVISSINKENFIIDTVDNSSNEFAVIYGGSPSSKYGANFMKNEGEKYIKKNVVYSNFDVSLDKIESELKKLNPNNKVVSVSGFSAGGSNTLKALDSGEYKFIGLIDPAITSIRRSLPPNTKMISRSENWTKYPNIMGVLNQMEDDGLSEKVSSTFYNHDEMPEMFFKKYSNLI
jgi:hypothetical protein